MSADRLQAIKARAAAASDPEFWADFYNTTFSTEVDSPTAEFIAASRADVDWLVQQVENLRWEVEQHSDGAREATNERDKWRIEALRLSTEANRWRDQAKEYQARLDAVTALLDQWEREAGPDSNAWAVYGPQKLSTPFAVNQLHTALNGDPGE